MFVRRIEDEQLAQVSYLIGCQRTGEAIVIDPERDIDRYIDLAKQQGLRIVAATETHIHADFLSGLREFGEHNDTLLLVSGEGGADWTPGWLDQHSSGSSYNHRLIMDGETFAIGNIEFKVVHTPGHTPEHVSFLVTDHGGGADSPMRSSPAISCSLAISDVLTCSRAPRARWARWSPRQRSFFRASS